MPSGQSPTNIIDNQSHENVQQRLDNAKHEKVRPQVGQQVLKATKAWIP